MARVSKKKVLEQTSQQTNIYRTAIYTRLSVLNNNKADNEDSIENQVDIITDYIKDKTEFNVLKNYSDNGYSGITFERPAFQEMLKDIQNNKIDCVIVKDLSRLGREYIQTCEYIQEIFPSLNVRFIAINNNIDTNNLDSFGNLILNFTNFSNNIYAYDISEKIIPALRTLQEKGSFIGSNPPYGYQKVRDEESRIVRLVVDEEVADNVRLIFKLKSEGQPHSKILDYLHENDIIAPYEYLYQKGELKKDKTKIYYWSQSTIKRILKSEIYIGNMVQGKKKSNIKDGVKEKHTAKEDWIRVENTHEPIVSKELFYQVQEIVNNVTSNYHSNLKYTDIRTEENIFKGKLKCECGGNLVFRIKSRKYKEKISFAYQYECPNPRPRGVS